MAAAAVHAWDKGRPADSVHAALLGTRRPARAETRVASGIANACYSGQGLGYISRVVE